MESTTDLFLHFHGIFETGSVVGNLFSWLKVTVFRKLNRVYLHSKWKLFLVFFVPLCHCVPLAVICYFGTNKMNTFVSLKTRSTNCISTSMAYKIITCVQCQRYGKLDTYQLYAAYRKNGPKCQA